MGENGLGSLARVDGDEKGRKSRRNKRVRVRLKIKLAIVERGIEIKSALTTAYKVGGGFERRGIGRELAAHGDELKIALFGA
jgi:hypothetical protein